MTVDSSIYKCGSKPRLYSGDGDETSKHRNNKDF